MFVVESASGQHRLYGTAGELGAAIRKGELTAQARIYHRSTDRWLPITVHPEFRKVEEEHEQRTALALRMRRWTFLQAEAAEPAVATPEAAPSAPAESENAGLAGERRSWLGSTFRRLRRLTPRPS